MDEWLSRARDAIATAQATPGATTVTGTARRAIDTGTAAVTDLRYRRVMDWDIEPTAFDVASMAKTSTG